MLHCETAEEDSLLSVANQEMNSDMNQKCERKKEGEANNSDTDSSDGSNCLVANESIRVSDHSPGLRRIRKQVSFRNSYKRRIVDHARCSRPESPSCANKEHLNYSPTALLSNNSPVQDEIAVSQMSRPHRSSRTVKPDNSFEKENMANTTEMSPGRRIMLNQSNTASVLRLVSMNSLPPVHAGKKPIHHGKHANS